MNYNTVILTSNGYYKIGDLENQNVHIYNGLDFSQTKIVKLNKPQQLLKIYFSNGCVINCDKNTYFFTLRDNYLSKSNMICSEYIKKNDEILILKEIPQTSNIGSLYNAYREGKKINTLCELNVFASDLVYKNENIDFNTNVVPINYNTNTKIKWLNGLLENAIGFQQYHDNNKVIILNSYYINFLEKIFILLQTLSCHPVILNQFNESKKKDEQYKHSRGHYYTLVINNRDIQKLYILGLFINIDFICIDELEFYEYDNTDSDNIKNVIYVTDVINTNTIEDMFYCSNKNMNIVSKSIKIGYKIVT